MSKKKKKAEAKQTAAEVAAMQPVRAMTGPPVMKHTITPEEAVERIALGSRPWAPRRAA